MGRTTDQTLSRGTHDVRNAPLSVVVEARAAYELLMSLATFVSSGEDRAFEVGDDWFRRARELAGPELSQAVERLAGRSAWVFGNILGLAIDTPEPRDGAAFVRHLHDQDARDLHLALVGHTLRPFRRVTPPGMMTAAIDGDADARAVFEQSSFPDDPTWPDALHGLLGMTSEEVKRLLIRVAGEYDQRVLGREAEALMATAERDAAEKRALLATMSPEQVIEAATRGWDYVPEPGVTRIILAPTVTHRPFNTTADHHDTRIFCYAVSDESLAASASDPPAFLVRRLKALADERRLRILRLLTTERRTLQELADAFDMPKTTVHHHLAILRAAGFIHLRDEPLRQYSPFPRYSYRAEALPRAMDALAAYLAVEDR